MKIKKPNKVMTKTIEKFLQEEGFTDDMLSKVKKFALGQKEYQIMLMHLCHKLEYTSELPERLTQEILAAYGLLRAHNYKEESA